MREIKCQVVIQKDIAQIMNLFDCTNLAEIGEHMTEYDLEGE